MNKLFCLIGLHSWEDFNCEYLCEHLPDLHTPIIKELTCYRVCKLCGKKEVQSLKVKC